MRTTPTGRSIHTAERASDQSGGGVTDITSSDGSIIVDPISGVGSVDLTVAPSIHPLFQLALSYGQGSAGNDDLGVGESFWLQPQSVNLSPEADQIHEWPLSRDLAFIGLTIFVDAADITLAEGGEDPRFIVTIDGVDTVFQVALTEGVHSDELLEAGGDIAVPAGSRIGVRFSGEGVDAGSTLRCELIVDGAQTGAPIPPPPIPTSGLLLDLASENYSITPSPPGGTSSWLDTSGSANHFATGSLTLARLPQIEAAAFNADPGIVFDRGFGTDTAEPQNVAPVWYGPNTPRTFAIVVRGDNISLGTLFHQRGVAVSSENYAMIGGSSPQLVWVQNGGNIQNTTPFFDLNGVKAVLFFDSTGGVGDALRLWVNGVAATMDATMLAEGAASFLEIGHDEDVFFPFSLRFKGAMARILTWNRVLTASERIGVISNLTARYL